MKLALQLKPMVLDVIRAVVRGQVLRSRRATQPGATDRILTVSKGWVAVTAPQAARPPAMKALVIGCVSMGVLSRGGPRRSGGKVGLSHPVVVDMIAWLLRVVYFSARRVISHKLFLHDTMVKGRVRGPH